MSQLFVDNITSKSGGAIGAPSGVVVTGVVTATSFSGDGSGLSGIDATALKDSGGNVKLQGNTSGIVVTGVSTFSGNITVGGVLTYDDVTNVDSVGLITARSGIKIGAGQSVSAVSGIATYYGDGSKLSGIELGTQSFVASGAIANGQTVIIKTDGTVGIVTQTNVDSSVGTPGTFNSGATSFCPSTFDSNSNKIIVVYSDAGNSSYGTAVVGTISGTSISFGSEVVFESATVQHLSVTFDSNSNKVVIAYSDTPNSQHGTAVVGTVSGTSISFGSPVVFNSGATYYTAATFDSNSNKVVIAYRDAGNSSRGTAIVGTVSGTSISFGSEVTYTTAGSSNYNGLTFDTTNNKVILVYSDPDNSFYGTSRVGTVSGTSISFGTKVVFESASTSRISPTYDSSNQRVVIGYRGTSGYGRGIVGTVSGTNISFGTPVVFESASVFEVSSVYDSDNGKVVICYYDSGNSQYGTSVYGTVDSSDNSITFSTPFVFVSSGVNYVGSAYDSSNNKVAITYADSSSPYPGKSVVYTTGSLQTNLTAENYIGIAAEAISNTATGKINVVAGINEGQTGLTTAQKYFVQPDGTLATSAGSPSVVAGTAISDTKIVVR